MTRFVVRVRSLLRRFHLGHLLSWCQLEIMRSYPFEFIENIWSQAACDRGWLATEGEEVRKVEVHTLHVTIVSLTVSPMQAMLTTTRAETSDLAMLGYSSLCMFSNTKYGLLLYLPSDSNIKSRLGEMEDRDFAFLDPPNVSIVS